MGNGKSGYKKKKSYHKFEYGPSVYSNMKNDVYFGANSNFNDWKKGLNEPEKEAIANFTGSGYITMNKELYSDFKDFNELSGYTKQHSYQLQKALNNFELNEPILVKRATSTSYLLKPGETVESLEGKTKIFDGFMSSSAANEPAFDDSIYLNISVPSGKGIGAWVGSMSEHPGETEFLFNAGSALKFGKPYKVGSGWGQHWEVDVEYVGKSSKVPLKGKKKKSE